MHVKRIERGIRGVIGVKQAIYTGSRCFLVVTQAPELLAVGLVGAQGAAVLNAVLEVSAELREALAVAAVCSCHERHQAERHAAEHRLTWSPCRGAKRWSHTPRAVCKALEAPARLMKGR